MTCQKMMIIPVRTGPEGSPEELRWTECCPEQSFERYFEINDPAARDDFNSHKLIGPSRSSHRVNHLRSDTTQEKGKPLSGYSVK